MTENQEKRPRGRPEGSMNKLAREAREKAAATGMLPHEILLSMARGEPQPQPIIDTQTGKLLGQTFVVADLEQRKDAAKAAAPYYAPRIQSVEVTHGVSDDNLDAIIASLAAEAGVDLGALGESAAPEAAPPGRRRYRYEEDE